MAEVFATFLMARNLKNNGKKINKMEMVLITIQIVALDMKDIC